MAELHSVGKRAVNAGSGASPRVAPPAPGRGRIHPLWRGILSPSDGQRVLILGQAPHGVSEFLRDEGVTAGGQGQKGGEEGGPYDLVIEGIRARAVGMRSVGSRSSLVVPGGRWVAVVEGAHFVGLRGRAVLGRMRREGFEKVETLYAHPSLSSPEFLVPLDRVEPIRYFLELAMGDRTFRKRCLVLGFLLLAKLGLHRELLPNLILIARR